MPTRSHRSLIVPAPRTDAFTACAGPWYAGAPPCEGGLDGANGKRPDGTYGDRDTVDVRVRRARTGRPALEHPGAGGYGVRLADVRPWRVG